MVQEQLPRDGSDLGVFSFPTWSDVAHWTQFCGILRGTGEEEGILLEPEEHRGEKGHEGSGCLGRGQDTGLCASSGFEVKLSGHSVKASVSQRSNTYSE